MSEQEVKNSAELLREGAAARERAVQLLERAAKEDMDGRIRVELNNRAQNAAQIGALYDIGAALLLGLENITKAIWRRA
jgi:hypothetical protein